MNIANANKKSAGKRIIPATRNNNNLAIIAGFKKHTFTPEQGNGGFAIRAIEIHRFFKMRLLIESFCTITGYMPDEYEIPFIDAEIEEVNWLIERAQSLCQEKEGAVIGLESDIAGCNALLASAKSGRATSTSKDIKSELMAVIARKESAENRLFAAKQELMVCNGLFNLLADFISHIFKSWKSDLVIKSLSDIPRVSLPVEAYRAKAAYDSSSRPCVYGWERMDELEKALTEIITSCTPSKDKYKIANGGNERAEAYQFYYSQAGEETRLVMSVIDYTADLNSLIKERQRHNALVIGDL